MRSLDGMRTITRKRLQAIERQIAALKDERRIMRRLLAVVGRETGGRRPKTKRPARRRPVHTPDGRKRIAAAMRARWAEAKRNGRTLIQKAS